MKQIITGISVIFLFIILGNACAKKEDTELKSIKTNSIYGNWSRIGFENNNVLFVRTKNLTTDGYGLRFMEDGSFIERKNAGWCGTPPVSYDNYKGNWKAINDSTLAINVTYWGGMMKYKLVLKAMKQDTLTAEFVY